MSQTMREALQAAANYIDTLGGDSKRYRCVLASSEQAQQGAERLMDELEAALREDGYEFAHQGPAVCAWIEGLGASRPAATAPAGGVTALREALQFYANGDHFVKHDPDVWDTVSGEPANLWEDEANSATVEDGSIARTALTAAARAAEPDGWLYVMHMEGGQKNKAFSDERYDFPTHSPFGRRGRDYSEEYEVTEHPIHLTAPPPTAEVEKDAARKFQLGARVEKIKGSQWKGKVVGFYSTTLTPEGYAVESDTEKGSVQIYPASALAALQSDQAQAAKEPKQ